MIGTEKNSIHKTSLKAEDVSQPTKGELDKSSLACTTAPSEASEPVAQDRREPVDSDTDVNHASQSTPFATLFQKIGEIKDSLLPALGIVYGLGYVVSSVTAWGNNLGLLPLIQSQYFLAGIVPAIAIYTGLVIDYWARPFVAWLTNWFEKEKRPYRTGVLFLAMILIEYLLSSLGSRSNVSTKSLVILVEYAIICAEFLIVESFLIASGVLLKRSAGALKFRGVPIVFGVICLSLYTLNLYPNMPQAFGGARPRQAFLDISTEAVSTDMLQALLLGEPDPYKISAPALNPPPKVISSCEVDVYFSSPDYLLVKPHIVRKGKQVVYALTYEVGKDAVKGIRWVN